ncbi:MAG TPA: hypothetical protein VF816_11920 [Rhodocyclaceae bacterium]
MRRILAGIIFLSVAASADAQFSDLFRSMTNALQGGGARKQPQQQGATAVIGVRGMDEKDNVAAAPAATEDYKLMEGWAATTAEAEALARKTGLASRPATLGKADAAKTEAADGSLKGGTP